MYINIVYSGTMSYYVVTMSYYLVHYAVVAQAV